MPRARSNSNRSQVTDSNPNTTWIHHPGFRVTYVFLCIAAWLTVRLFTEDNAVAWSIVLQVHAIFTFFAVHWVKGAPENSAGVWNDKIENQTFWEQIDEGELGTPDRRFLSIMPVALFVIALLFIDEEHNTLLAFNVLSTLILIAAKMNGLFGVRIFGINSA